MFHQCTRLIAAGIALIGLIVMIAIGAVSVVLNVTVWLLGQVGVLCIRLVGLLIRGVRWLIRALGGHGASPSSSVRFAVDSSEDVPGQHTWSETGAAQGPGPSSA